MHNVGKTHPVGAYLPRPPVVVVFSDVGRLVGWLLPRTLRCNPRALSLLLPKESVLGLPKGKALWCPSCVTPGFKSGIRLSDVGIPKLQYAFLHRRPRIRFAAAAWKEYTTWVTVQGRTLRFVGGGVLDAPYGGIFPPLPCLSSAPAWVPT